MNTFCKHFLLALTLAASAQIRAFAQDQISTRLTDTVSQGKGAINLLKDLSADQFARQVSSGGKLFFGVDVNENASGNENANSIGVALQNVQLVVTTTTGRFVFSNFSTSTTATLTEAGSKNSGTYYTLFGQIGSSQITGSTGGFDLGRFDDVLSVSDIYFTGEVLSAQMSVTLLDTGSGKDASSGFFDFSGGYEDLALLSNRDAYTLEQAEIGVSGAPAEVTYTKTAPVIVATEVTQLQPLGGSSSASVETGGIEGAITPATAPAAPAPPLWVLGMLLLFIVGMGERRVRAATPISV